jgi:HEPN domain-containing protein
LKRRDFQDLAAVRLKEAKVLLRAGCHEGAYYLGGYVVECALKGCIAKRTERHEFPDKKRVLKAYTHDLQELIGLAGVEPNSKEPEKASRELNDNWAIVRDWSEESRYERISMVEAENLVQAVGDPEHGVLQWLKRFW